MISIQSVPEGRNVIRKHGFKLFSVFGFINTLIHYFEDILATLPNVARIAIIANEVLLHPNFKIKHSKNTF